MGVFATVSSLSHQLGLGLEAGGLNDSSVLSPEFDRGVFSSRLLGGFTPFTPSFVLGMAEAIRAIGDKFLMFLVPSTAEDALFIPSAERFTLGGRAG
jgi:hypothetical protein